MSSKSVARLWLPCFAGLLLMGAGCATRSTSKDGALTRIAFGSCINTQLHPMLDRTLTLPFDLFILLGDNIYADTTNPAVMERKYRVRKESAFFQELRKKAPVVATWDDHDFGGNDTGSNYVMRVDSQKLFLEFMDEPANSPRRQREGVYNSYIVSGRKRVFLGDGGGRGVVETGLVRLIFRSAPVDCPKSPALKIPLLSDVVEGFTAGDLRPPAQVCRRARVAAPAVPGR